MAPAKVDILVLGAGWTSTFLIPYLKSESITHAETTTTGLDGTYKFKFEDHESSSEGNENDLPQYAALPPATTILITFPIKSKNGAKRLYNSYIQTHDEPETPYQFIQLGSTGIFTIPDQDLWVTRHSRYDKTYSRAVAEDQLRELGGCVLNLSGLWGGERQPKNWVERVAGTKDQLREKTSLHMVHGLDVSRAIVAVHRKFDLCVGERWMLTDMIVYDWWALILGFGGELDEKNGNKELEMAQIKWVGELMAETGIRALPRSMEQLGRCYDTREFWEKFGIMPVRSRI